MIVDVGSSFSDCILVLSRGSLKGPASLCNQGEPPRIARVLLYNVNCNRDFFNEATERMEVVVKLCDTVNVTKLCSGIIAIGNFLINHS